MTLRITTNDFGDIIHYTRLDLVSLSLDDPITPLVLNNLALLKLTTVGDKVDDVGVRLTRNVWISCELPPGHNEGIEDILIYVKATY